MSEWIDVIVVGAGLSGISAAYHLKTRCPDRSFAVLEGRARLGGTWDLFRYPGVRSDSDMHTLGFGFRPWTEAKAIADGASILRYLDETAAQYGIEPHIRYGHRLRSADWSSDAACWNLTVEREGEVVAMRCRFLYLCTGYYNYARGHAPDLPGADRFAGQIIHPQFWPQDLDPRGVRIVVIGSGATAVTLVPELARSAAQVTMLQRSPSYVVAQPAEDRVANALRRVLPGRMAYALTRWKNVLLQQFFYRLARRYPDAIRRRLIAMAGRSLGSAAAAETHFAPSYKPWDQRVCLVPDADLFRAIRRGKARVVTDRIDRLLPTGIRLASGDELDADLIVTATGLEIQLFGGATLSVDGAPFDPAGALVYKGMMFEGVPNLAIAFGYTNASWTLKADLTAAYVARLLKAMRRRRMRQVTPRPSRPAGNAPFLDFTSGYVQRAASLLPRQGDRAPWRVHQSYARDLIALRFGGIDDEMVFSSPEPA